jgi:hypothetical protein
MNPTQPLTADEARKYRENISAVSGYASLPEAEKARKVVGVYDAIKNYQPHFKGLALERFNSAEENVEKLRAGNMVYLDSVRDALADALGSLYISGGRKRSAISTKFNRCVKSVRKTVKARKGSNKESAAIAICTTSVLHTRKRTMKKYRKGRLVTQRRKRGGA